MKKALIIISATLVFLLLAIIAIPYFYKSKLVNILKTEINKELNATVNFNENINLSLLRQFPHLSLGVKNINVIGKGTFEGDTLLDMEAFGATIDVMSLFSGDEIRIKEIYLKKPLIHVIVLEDGTANYDISKTSDETTTDTAETAPFKISLSKYSVSNAHIIYDDKASHMFADIVNLNHVGKGDFTQDIFILETETAADALTFNYGGISYFNKVNTILNADLEMNMPEMRFTVQNKLLKLNSMEAGLAGFIALLPDDKMDMDLKLDVKKNTFKELLSLVPAVFMRDFEKIKTAGNFKFNASAKGLMDMAHELYPAFDVNLAIDKASFSYPDLPEKLNNIVMKVNINSPGGILDNTVVNLSELSFALGQEPFFTKLLVKKPMSNPLLNLEAKGKIILDNIKKLIPLEKGMDIGGVMNAALAVSGNAASIEKQDFEALNAQGQLILEGFRYKDIASATDMAVKLFQLDFTPKQVSLLAVTIKMGESDLSLKGNLSNFIGYLFKSNETLSGNLLVQSNYFDANPFMTESTESTTTTADSAPMEVLLIPDNVDFTLEVDMKRLKYDNLNIENIKGKTQVKNQALNLNGLSADIFNGNVLFTGNYDSKNQVNPTADMGVKVSDLNIGKAYEGMNTIKQLMPIAKYLNGNLNAAFSLKTLLNKNMEPDLASLFSQGNLATIDLMLSGFEPMNKIGNVLNLDRFKTISLQNTLVSYKIEDGKVMLEDAVKFKANQIGFLIEKGGYTALDKSINYIIKLAIPREIFGSGANTALNNLLSEVGKTGAELKPNDIVNVNVLLGGTIDNPTVKTSLKEIGKGIVDNLKDQGKQLIDEKKKEAIETGKEKVNQWISQAEAKGDALVAEAKRNGDRLKAEAKTQTDKLKAESDKQAENLMKEAGNNPLKKVAAEQAVKKLRSETDKKINQINSETAKKADDLVKSAENEKLRLVEEARKKVN